MRKRLKESIKIIVCSTDKRSFCRKMNQGKEHDTIIRIIALNSVLKLGRLDPIGVRSGGGRKAAASSFYFNKCMNIRYLYYTSTTRLFLFLHIELN